MTATRTATIRTELDDAEIVAASVRPDNTDEIDTCVERDGDDQDDGSAVAPADGRGDRRTDGVGTVVTTVERETTGGLRTTVDDYVVNLAVAQKVVQAAKRHEDDTTQL